MNQEEFKNKFKVGDEILSDKWFAKEAEEIKYIGETCFLTVDEDGIESLYHISEYRTNWIKPPKKVEQDLADCFEAVQIIPSYSDKIYCRLVFVNRSEFDAYQDRHSSHLITIEEAKARGLKINR